MWRIIDSPGVVSIFRHNLALVVSFVVFVVVFVVVTVFLSDIVESDAARFVVGVVIVADAVAVSDVVAVAVVVFANGKNGNESANGVSEDVRGSDGAREDEQNWEDGARVNVTD